MTNILAQFVHISDTHISPDPDYGRDQTPYTAQAGVKALVQQINALPFTPDFILHTGDVAYDPDPGAYPVARALLGSLRPPIYFTTGNHDDPAALQTILIGTRTPRLPFYYSVEINGVRLACLDSTGPAEPPRGSVSQEQLDWLEALCAAPDERPLLVAIHHNVLPASIPWLDEYMGLTNGEAFHRALLPGRHRVRGVFFGHVHQDLDLLRDGILYASAASSWAQFHAWPGQADTLHDATAQPGFSVVTVTREQTYIRRCRFQV